MLKRDAGEELAKCPYQCNLGVGGGESTNPLFTVIYNCTEPSTLMTAAFAHAWENWQQVKLTHGRGSALSSMLFIASRVLICPYEHMIHTCFAHAQNTIHLFSDEFLLDISLMLLFILG